MLIGLLGVAVLSPCGTVAVVGSGVQQKMIVYNFQKNLMWFFVLYGRTCDIGS